MVPLHWDPAITRLVLNAIQLGFKFKEFMPFEHCWIQHQTAALAAGATYHVGPKNIVQHYDWCEAPLVYFSLWDGWIDSSWPNAPTVLKSMVPTLTNTQKSVVLAIPGLHKQRNLASLVRGVRYHRNWWWQFRRALGSLNNRELIPDFCCENG